MPKIYLVLQTYAPYTAATNRFMGLIKAFSKQNIKTEVIFLFSTEKDPKLPQLPNIHYRSFFNYVPTTNTKIQNILYLTVYKWLLKRILRKGDKIYLYSCNEYIQSMVHKKGIKVYHERTEHPEVVKMKILNIKKYLAACTKLDGLFVITKGLKNYFTSVGVPEENVHIVNMTVEVNRFLNLKPTKDERYIAYCGKATNNKDGVDRLLKAFSIVVKSHPDVKLYIIGTPPNKQEISGTLELIEQLGIAPNVVLKGIIPSDQIPQILKNAEILALARPNSQQAQYGFPTKLGEYLLTQNPVVITRTGEIPLFLKDKENALLCNPDDIKEFAEKLNWALDHPEAAKIIGKNGYQVALNNFNSEIEALKIVKQMTI